MGKYRATMNLGGHRRGEVLDLDDDSPVTVRRVNAGWIVRTDIVAAEAAPKKRATKRSKAVEADEGTEVADEAVEATTEADSAPTEADSAPVEESSVQTAWTVAD
jgi:hypothetical protein